MKSFPAIALGLCMIIAAGAHASVIYEIDIYTDNGIYSDDGGVDLYFDVTDFGQGKVLFEIFNADTIDSSSIKSIHFGGGDALLDNYSIINGQGVEFFEDKRVSQLQGGMNSVLDTDYSMSAKNPAPVNGINSGEKVGILFDLSVGSDFDTVNEKLASGQIFVGVHLIALPDGSSEWAINNPIPIPEPATVALLIIGVTTLTISRKKAKA